MDSTALGEDSDGHCEGPAGAQVGRRQEDERGGRSEGPEGEKGGDGAKE